MFVMHSALPVSAHPQPLVRILYARKPLASPEYGGWEGAKSRGLGGLSSPNEVQGQRPGSVGAKPP